LILNCTSLFLVYLLANFNNLLSWDFVGAHNTISSAKRPPQQYLSPIEIPYLSHLLKMSLMNKLNKIGERGQPLSTPFLILNDSDNCPSTLTQALEDKYKFLINL